uniref:tyrosine-type recombinase/integrase n=1 Tax=Sphingomonas sp. TaxID=28214 RepID=UPI0025E9B624
MARGLNRLTSREVASMKATGRHSDGGGLYLRITAAGSRSWVFMSVREGKRAEIGLGPAANLSLAAARRLAAEMREAIALGSEPRQVLAKPERATPPAAITFGAFAEQYIASVEAGWTNPIHRQQWRSSLRDHAALLRDIPVAEVDTDRVLAVLSPIWLSKAETARRLRGRIETILAAAMARELRPRDQFNLQPFEATSRYYCPSNRTCRGITPP